MAKRANRGRRGRGDDSQQRASTAEATATATVSGLSVTVPVAGPASASASVTVGAPAPAPAQVAAPTPAAQAYNRFVLRMLGVAVVGAAGTAAALWALGLTLWAAVPLSLVLGFYALVFGCTLQVPHSRVHAWGMVESAPPEEVQEAIRTAAEEVGRLGFEPRGVACFRDDDLEHYVWCADHPERHEVAGLVVERKLGKPGLPLEASLSFTTRLKGRHRLATICSPDPQVGVGHPGILNFPSVRDAASLYRIHRLRTAAVHDSVEPPPSGTLPAHAAARRVRPGDGGAYRVDPARRRPDPLDGEGRHLGYAHLASAGQVAVEAGHPHPRAPHARTPRRDRLTAGRRQTKADRGDDDPSGPLPSSGWMVRHIPTIGCSVAAARMRSMRARWPGSRMRAVAAW